MAAESVVDIIYSHIPEIILLVGGIIALVIVRQYLKNEASAKYKLFMALGVIFGALMIALCVTSYAEWALFPSVIIVVTGFTLVIRPFREVHFAVIGALLIMALVYLLLAGAAGTLLDFLAEGWPRIIATLIIGSIAFSIMSFVEGFVKLFGKLLNWWPLLLVLALICIVESLLMLLFDWSLYDFVTGGL